MGYILIIKVRSPNLRKLQEIEKEFEKVELQLTSPKECWESRIIDNDLGVCIKPEEGERV